MPTEDDEDLDNYFDLIEKQFADPLLNNEQIDCMIVCVFNYSRKFQTSDAKITNK